MSGLISDGQALTLADYEGLVTDKDVSRKVLINTIRDYMPFFDQAICNFFVIDNYTEVTIPFTIKLACSACKVSVNNSRVINL